MATISTQSSPARRAFPVKTTLVLIAQWIGAFVAFIVSMIAANLISPLPNFILDEVPEMGFMTGSGAMLLSAAVNATLLVWMARRSSFKGFGLAGQLFCITFLAQVFQTQIETAYFLYAFPLLQGNFEVYRLILRGAISSAVFVLPVTLIVGGFSHKPRRPPQFTVEAAHAVKTGAWLAAVYVALYILFGYFVAWQSQDVRFFYGGPAALNSFVDQMRTTLMSKPELPFFQYFRGILWILCLIPLFKGFSGGRVELILLAALTLALLPTVQLAFPNPLMPGEVSLAHFWEVSLSMAVFGALCAWSIPTRVSTEG